MISAEYLDHRLDTDDATYGWPVQFDEVPSPADLELVILGRKDAISYA